MFPETANGRHNDCTATYMEKNYEAIIPPQYTGSELDVRASITLNDETRAKQFFRLARERLLNVNNWHTVAKGISAIFRVVNANGQEMQRNVQQGDYLKIDIPGPGSKDGNGYDWVSVEEVLDESGDNSETVAFRVRPSQNPIGDGENVAHFYDETATSSFIVVREGSEVTALVIDKNLKPNLSTHSLTDKVRGATVGTTALAVVSKIQWQNLVDGIVGE